MTATGTELRLGHRPALDGLRGLAVLLVLAGHLSDDRITHAGGTGVTLFLVLSGFLITRLLVEEAGRTGSVSFGNFYTRRALRLFPAMAVFLTVVGLWAALDGRLSAPVKFPALYVANIARAGGDTLGVLGHTWSLSLEEQFYLVWPLAVVVTLHRSRRRATTVAVGGIVLSLLTTLILGLTANNPEAMFDRLNFGPDTRSYPLFVGCLLGLRWDQWRPHAGLARRAVWPTIAVFSVATVAPIPHYGLRFAVLLPLAAFSTAVVMFDLLENDSYLRRILSTRRIVYCGRISYGLYLWHFPINEVARLYAAETPLLVRATAVTVLSFAAASASFHLVEQPFLRLKQHFRSPQPMVTVALEGA